MAADMNAYLNAMMQYWGPMMDVGLERARALPGRESAAFDEYIRRKRLERQMAEEGILTSQMERKAMRKEANKDVLSGAPKSRHSMAMADARTAGDIESYTGGRKVADLMRVKDVLDRIPRISMGGIGGTEAWRNLPAAADLTGQSFTPNPWVSLYQAAAGGPSQQAQAEAGANLRERRSGGGIG